MFSHHVYINTHIGKDSKIQLQREREIVSDLVNEFNREGTLHKCLQVSFTCIVALVYSYNRSLLLMY